MSASDLLNHLSRTQSVMRRFNGLRSTMIYKSTDVNAYDKEKCVAVSLNHCEPYMAYLYSRNYTEKMSNTATKYGEDILITIPSNLYMHISYRYRLILLPKFFISQNQKYIDLDVFVYQNYCRCHSLLSDLHTIQPYINPFIVKNFIKSMMDNLYQIYSYTHKININEIIPASKILNCNENNRNNFSRIWNQFIFNLHPSMIYIDNDPNWCSTVHIFVQFFRIFSHKNNKSAIQQQMVSYTEKEMKNLHYMVNICRAGGESEIIGQSDHQKYTAPELLPEFVENPVSKKKISLRSSAKFRPNIELGKSLSLHCNPNNFKEFIIKKRAPEFTFVNSYEMGSDAKTDENSIAISLNDEMERRQLQRNLSNHSYLECISDDAEIDFEDDATAEFLCISSSSKRRRNKIKDKSNILSNISVVVSNISVVVSNNGTNDTPHTSSKTFSLKANTPDVKHDEIWIKNIRQTNINSAIAPQTTKTSTSAMLDMNIIKHLREEEDDIMVYHNNSSAFSDVSNFAISHPLFLNLTTDQKKDLLPREDVKYLPLLWNLSSNLFSIGVILFMLLNGYPPFEIASINDRWYSTIIKKKFYKFWKLHRASPIIGINKAESIAPNNFDVSQMRHYTKKVSLTPKLAHTSTSQGTGHRRAGYMDPNEVASDDSGSDEDEYDDQSPFDFREKSRQSKTPGIKQSSISTYNVLIEQNMKQKPKPNRRRSRTTKEPVIDIPVKHKEWTFDYRSVQGLINDLLIYNSHQRLDTFFNYNSDDIDFGDNLCPLYYKYWWLNIGYVDCYDVDFDFESIAYRNIFNNRSRKVSLSNDEEINGNNDDCKLSVDITVGANDENILYCMWDLYDTNKSTSLDKNECNLLLEINKMHYQRQESNRKTAKRNFKNSKKVQYRCFCNLLAPDSSFVSFLFLFHLLYFLSLSGLYFMTEIQPLDYPFSPKIEGKSLCGSGELYSTVHWWKILHDMNHIFTDICLATVDVVYDDSRLHCSMKLANAIEIKFAVKIWRSVRFKQQMRNGNYVYVVQWRRMYGNELDYQKVINKVIHEHCAELFDISRVIRNLLKN